METVELWPGMERVYVYDYVQALLLVSCFIEMAANVKAYGEQKQI